MFDRRLFVCLFANRITVYFHEILRIGKLWIREELPKLYNLG